MAPAFVSMSVSKASLKDCDRQGLGSVRVTFKNKTWMEKLMSGNPRYDLDKQCCTIRVLWTRRERSKV